MIPKLREIFSMKDLALSKKEADRMVGIVLAVVITAFIIFLSFVLPGG